MQQLNVKLYSIRDAKANTYTEIIMARTPGEAERHLASLANNKDTFVGRYPEDYGLWYLGEFDIIGGKLHPLEQPEHLVNAVQVVKQTQ